MYVKFEENRDENLIVLNGPEIKWSLRRTVLFLVISGILCWSAILFFVYLVFA